MILGNLVHLRPVTRSDLPLLVAWENDVQAQGSYNMFGFRSTDQLEQGFSQEGFLGDRQGLFLIVAAATPEEPIGSMNYRQVVYGPNSGSRPYAIGISIIAAQRGKGFGSEAQRLLAAYLFDTYPIIRVEASTDSSNIPEQRSLEKAGFTREGVLRKAQWRGGDWHDLVSYSKLRGE